MNDIKNNNFLDYDFYTKLQHLLFIGKIRETFNYYPPFIIKDDLFNIFNYFFGVSLFINNIRYGDGYNGNFKLEIIIIPKLIYNVYNQNILFAYNIGNINK